MIKQPKYTMEELTHCVGLMCIYEEYRINSSWKYSGEIVEVELMTFSRPDRIRVLPQPPDGERFLTSVPIINILEIPVFDKFKDKKLFKLVSDIKKDDEHG